MFFLYMKGFLTIMAQYRKSRNTPYLCENIVKCEISNKVKWIIQEIAIEQL